MCRDGRNEKSCTALTVNVNTKRLIYAGKRGDNDASYSTRISIARLERRTAMPRATPMSRFGTRAPR